LHPDDQARVKEEFEAAAAIAGDYESEFRIARPDGAIRHIHSLGHPVRGDRGEILEYVGTVIDVTERKRSEEALAAARAALAHVARVTTMGELTASIAHEVNQPLAAVAANANACLHWLAATPPNMAEAHGASQRIIRDANRASDVIRGIRAFLMRGAPQNCALHLDELLREVADMVLEEARAKGVAIVVAAPNGAPSVRGDRIQLQQVILNLLVNAVDAVGAVQGRARTVELAAQRHGQGQACVTVRDSGPGLDPRFRERVFDAFYTTKPHGMGMGLAISRTIVETHGGRLWCTPNEGGSGETFHFTIPTEGAPSA
jgi:signal transduction histidine kinase